MSQSNKITLIIMSLHRFFGGKSALRAIARAQKNNFLNQARQEASAKYPDVKLGDKKYEKKQDFIARRVSELERPQRDKVEAARAALNVRLQASAARGRAQS